MLSDIIMTLKGKRMSNLYRRIKDFIEIKFDKIIDYINEYFDKIQDRPILKHISGYILTVIAVSLFIGLCIGILFSFIVLCAIFWAIFGSFITAHSWIIPISGFLLCCYVFYLLISSDI
jgi:hypothetical protein